MASNRSNFGILFFKRQWRLFGIMFDNIKSASSIMFIFLFVLSMALQVIIYEAGLVPSMYFEVLGAKDQDAFKSVAIYSMEIIIINALMKSTVTYLSQLLYVKWRGMLCSHIHTRYFTANNYYKLNVLKPSLDNIDQRIVRDVNLSCQEWSTLMSRLLVIPFTIAYYSYQCFISTTYLGPIFIYVYFICGTIINRFLMSPVVRTTITREKHEGDFRFQHLQVRVNAESMAFYQAEQIENYKSNNRLQSLLGIQRTLYGWSFWLNSSVNIFDYVGGILSYLIIAIPIFGGEYDDLAPEELSALISRNAFVCIYLIYSFSQLFDMSRVVSDIAGHTHRLGELLEEIDENEFSVEKQTDKEDNDQYHSFTNIGYQESEESEYTDNSDASDLEKIIERSQKDDICFQLTNVTYATPDGSSDLLENFSLKISAGKNLLVTGETGCGKTSLFRILSKLWEPRNGTVNRLCDIGRRGVMFLPQKPLCTDGTIKQLVTYPSMDGYSGYSLSIDHERIMNILDEVELTDLYVRMGGVEEREEVNWADKLSPGEMQRITFARLFYHEPKFAVLDEPTSALNVEMADMLFELCKEKNITCITAGHSDLLLKHHDIRLHLNGDGTWKHSTLL
ncbi:lysosomal cobalamin transporter ABCD4-like [Styela clava]